MAAKDYKGILAKALVGVIPDKSIDAEIAKVVAAINNSLKQKKLKARCILGGSVAKGTFLKGDHDIDLFVKFDYSYKDKDISKLLHAALKHSFKDNLRNLEEIHGSRGYYRFSAKLFSYEIVPVLSVKNPKKAMNVTDMSPLHVEWVLKSSQRIRDEIRIAKLFCKAAGIYGAESYIKGFSGHVLDILIIHFKGFIQLLKASQPWKKRIAHDEKIVIDFYNAHKGYALRNINTSKMQGPLVVVDPILSSRNAAAALSRESVEIFMKNAERFLKKPSEDFFMRKRIDEDYFRKAAKGKKLILLNVVPLKDKDDIMGAKLLKVFSHLKSQLKFYDFEVNDKSSWSWDKGAGKALMGIILDKDSLPRTKVHEGPPIALKSYADAFRKIYKKTSVRNNRLYAEIARKYTDAKELVNDAIKSDYVIEKVKKIGIIKV